MGPDVTRNQGLLCWRGPAAIWLTCNEQVRVQMTSQAEGMRFIMSEIS
jgi:hypothetical protein